MNTKIECLLIDDDLDDQEIFSICIQEISQKIKCSFAENGVDAIQLLEQNKLYLPDYIFIDVNMPKMNGIECLMNIKNMNRIKDSKVFMLSTTAEKSIVKECKNLGAVFIMKPTSMSELKLNLSNIFESSGIS